MTSLELANKLGVRHSQVLKTIEEAKEFSSFFKETTVYGENDKGFKGFKIEKFGETIIYVLLESRSNEHKEIKTSILKGMSAIENFYQKKTSKRIEKVVGWLIANKIVSYEECKEAIKTFAPILKIFEVETGNKPFYQVLSLQEEILSYMETETGNGRSISYNGVRDRIKLLQIR
jgi:hypothetical protein